MIGIKMAGKLTKAERRFVEEHICSYMFGASKDFITKALEVSAYNSLLMMYAKTRTMH